MASHGCRRVTAWAAGACLDVRQAPLLYLYLFFVSYAVETSVSFVGAGSCG